MNATGADYGFLLRHGAQPLLLEVDREFDLFRLLDPRETAPSIGQIFGEQEILAVLPSGSSREELQAWRELLDAWQSDAHSIAVILDSELDEVPPGTAAWLLGSSNVVAARLFASAQTADVSFGTDELIIAGTGVPLANHSTIAVRRHPDDATKAIGWITVNPPQHSPALRRNCLTTASTRISHSKATSRRTR